MQISFEGFLLVNLLVDAALLSIISRSCGNFKGSRMLYLAAACALYAFIAIGKPSPWASPLIQLILLIPVSILLTGTTDIRQWPIAGLLLVAGMLLIGGIKQFLPEHPASAVSGVCIGLTITFLLLAVRSHLRTTWHVDLLLVLNGRSACIHALIDTGNRLHEPISGLPVIIIEEPLISRIMPESGYRQVAFGGLGGSGCLSCFRPDEIWILEGRKKIRAPNAWIGVSDIPLPGAARALAPGEFAAIP